MIIYEAEPIGRDYYKGLVKLEQKGTPVSLYVLSVIHKAEITEFRSFEAWGLHQKKKKESL